MELNLVYKKRHAENDYITEVVGVYKDVLDAVMYCMNQLTDEEAIKNLKAKKRGLLTNYEFASSEAIYEIKKEELK